ncbi:permease prefix domain 1-containing protein [Lederbergia panacisoli]|uniref:permease prefix domain 1-containing protein n=1 Tax=Lederbergia panacisoli TaxID=1255251 RepID=UPI00214BF62C|nr:permease prefix domain 1-containing protein [Lederbergia panacisoli]MCR2821467.1 permease prefix domain 1-containing protein [Lederbergia panacisoli]
MMHELRVYVDHLFRKYNHHPDSDDLKEEILGNLEAKVSHLVAEGLDEKSAIERAKSSITNIDDLIDSNVTVRINQFRFKAYQIAFLFLIVAWIITIPFTIVGIGIIVNFMLFLVVLALFVVYLFLGKTLNQEKIGHLNIVSFMKTKKVVWVLWVLFIIITWGSLTAILFGSNLWFARPIHIDGPYQFGILVARYALPFISIIIPLIFTACGKIIAHFEVGGQHE